MNTRSPILLLLLAMLSSGCMSTGTPAEDDNAKAMCARPADEVALQQEVLDLVNTVRRDEGLEPLAPSDVLDEVAGGYACEMIADEFFAHEHPVTHRGAGERLTAVGYVYYAMGENLAVGQTTADEVFADWMNSPAHRENILSPFWQEAGVAVRTGGPYGWYWVQEFADPVELGQ